MLKHECHLTLILSCTPIVGDENNTSEITTKANSSQKEEKVLRDEIGQHVEFDSDGSLNWLTKLHFGLLFSCTKLIKFDSIHHLSVY